MRLLAEFVMRGRSPAIAVVAVAALLSLLLPPLSYLSGAAVALVTLRVGPVQGLTTALMAALAVAVLSLLLFGSPWTGGAFLAVLWFPVWALAVSLRRTARLPRTLLLAGWFGAVLVVGFYLAVDDPAAWWRESLETVLAQAGGGQGDDPQVMAALEPALGLMTGAAAAALLTSLLGSLCLARWWQSMLYNPGGFRREFHALQLGRGLTVATLALMALSTFGELPGHQLAAELLVVAGVLFVVQGLAVVHGLVGRTGAGKGWLIGTYALLLLALPQMAMTLAVAGVADNWFDFRARFGGKAGS